MFAEKRYLLGMITVLLFLMTGSGCTFSDNQQRSVLMVTVDSLKASDVTCTEVGPLSSSPGFSKFCEDSIRFTHALTTSVMSVPALSSLLTARYPYENGIWHNGNQFLSANVDTIAENVVKNGVRTAFFSGGPPIWRKTGLGQGFERFDDYVSLGVNRVYRSAGMNVDLFTSWLDSEVDGAPFFGVLYFPDIQFKKLSTKDAQGQLRPRSTVGQLEAVDSALLKLHQELMDRDLWHSTDIIVVGLNGRSEQRRLRELEPYNLYSENIRVPLFIKPASQRKDRSINWSVDANVNLVDVAVYIAEIFGVYQDPQRQRLAPAISIAKQVESKKSEWPAGRSLLVESGWPYWRLNSSTRFAVVKDEKLLVYDKKPIAFNIWSDRFQVSPLTDESSYADIELEIGSFLTRMGFTPFSYPESKEINKYLIAFELWGQSDPPSELLYELDSYWRGRKSDWEALQWRSYWAVNQGKWGKLSKIAEETRNSIYSYVANENLGKSINELPGDSCFGLLESDMKPGDILMGFRLCDDQMFREFVSWIKNGKSATENSRYKTQFLNSWRRHLIERRVKELNWSNGLVWDTNPQIGLGPSLVELAWSLPRYDKYKIETKKKVSLNY